MYAIGLFFIFIVFLVVGIPLLLLIIFFVKKQGFYAISILALLFGIGWFKITLNIEEMEQNIRDKSIERFGVEPEYIDINFDVLRAGGGTPHATVCKDGKKYYWSFNKKDFVFYFNTYCIDKKNRGIVPTPESLEKLFNETIFNKGAIKWNTTT